MKKKLPILDTQANARDLTTLFSTLDAARLHAHRSLKRQGHTLSCSRGCTSCCHLLVTCMFPEAVDIVATLQARGELDAFVEAEGARLEELERVLLQPDMTTQEWLRQWHRCPLLGENNDCTVYDRRPMTCRFHEVVSDPKLCSLPGVQVGTPDYGALRHAGLSALSGLSNHQGLPGYMGPLPVMLRWSIVLVREGEDALRNLLADHPANPYQVDSLSGTVFWAALEMPDGKTYQMDDVARSIECRICGGSTTDRDFIETRRCPHCRVDHLQRRRF